jgi:hypothetical protein
MLAFLTKALEPSINDDTAVQMMPRPIYPISTMLLPKIDEETRLSPST